MEYKIILHGEQFYREVKLKPENEKGLCIGTDKANHIVFLRDQVHIDFFLKIERQNGQWVLHSNEAVVTRKNQENQFSFGCFLNPEDSICICKADTKDILFFIDFYIDFQTEYPDFDRTYIADNREEITIGGVKGCSILIKNQILTNTFIKIFRMNGGWYLDASGAAYGIELNGYHMKGSKIPMKEYDIISLNGILLYWKTGKVGLSSHLEIDSLLSCVSIEQNKGYLQYPKFVRSARQQFVIPKEDISILPPKSKGEEPQKNLLGTMIPLLVSMGMMVMMRTLMGGRALYGIMCAGMGMVSVVMAIINYRNEGIQYRKNSVKRENDYNRYIAEQEEKIKELREKEKLITQQKYPALEERIKYVENFDPRLFEKQKMHDDFMDVRIGEGSVAANCEIKYREQEYREIEDPLMDYPEKIHDKYMNIDHMPVILHLKETKAIGVVGNRTSLYQFAKNLMLQFSIEYYYEDVKLFLLMEEEDKPYFEWARWMQNMESEGKKIRNFSYDAESRKSILEYLYQELSNREKTKEKEERPQIVVFVYHDEMLGEHPVSEYIEKASELGFLFIFFEEYAGRLNQYCEKRIFLNEDSTSGYVQDILDGEKIQQFTYQHVPVETAQMISSKLGGVYVDEVSVENTLTKNITLFQLLNISSVQELNLTQRWSQSQIYKSMAAPLGVKTGDEIVCLDLHEKYHGPHGLVAGTTGSGKSEILQSYILSMATLYHPYEVGFIIIDFKGGGMVNQFRDLPHLNGAITNIDGNEIDRSLQSIKAELQKRQRLFAEQGVNHIDDYIKAYKNKEAKIPLPHLILIVDEFAELKSEQPEFMKELISAARIGRSLGIHMILATQKPSGVVNDQIWSNSKFKLCLKVQNKSDSNEVLKSPLAAEIREPGRAYLQVGNNEIFQLFQSAYSGASVPNRTIGDQKQFQISKVSLYGRREVIFEQKPKAEDMAKTQLEAIVEYVSDYCQNSGIERLPNICLPALAQEIPYPEKYVHDNSHDITIPIAMLDDPANQNQFMTDINISRSHVMVVGSSQMGKTNLLQAMIRGLVENYSPKEVQIYILDFASMMLRNFSELKHVGGVIVSTEEEKLKTFYKMMSDEIEKRKEILSGLGLTSYSAYRESDDCHLPQIVILVDNLAALREMYLSLDDQMVKIAREGASVGIQLTVTANQSNGLGYKYLSNFTKRFALFCNDSGEYSVVHERCRTKLNMIPGRCIANVEKNIYEGQIFLAFQAQREIDKIQEIKEFVKQINDTYQESSAVKIPTMPEVITISEVEKMVTEDCRYDFPLGLNYDNLEVDYANITQFPLFGIGGIPGNGRKNFIGSLIDFYYTNTEYPVDFWVIDNEQKDLYEKNKKFSFYTNKTDDLERILNDVMSTTLKRAANQESKSRFLCFIINSQDAMKTIDNNPSFLELIDQILVNAKNARVGIILSDLLNQNIRSGSSDIMKTLSRCRNMMLFYPLDQQDIFEPGYQDKKKYTKPMTVGDAYFICGNYFGKYKTPKNDR